MSLSKNEKKTFLNSSPKNGSATLEAPPATAFFSDEKFSLMLDAIPSVVTYVDKNYCVRYVNKAFETIFNTPAHAVTGKPLVDFIGPAAFKLIRGYMDKALSGEKVHYEMYLPFSDGTRYVQSTYTPDFDVDGSVKGYISHITDITEKKKIELELIESELRYRALVENLPAAIYTCDKEGRINMFNKSAAELWGREPELGTDKWCGSWKIFKIDGITPISLDTCPMAVALKEGRAVKGEEIIIERPNGVRRNVRPHPIPLFDYAGQVTGALNMLIDVSEHAVNEQKLGQLAAIVHSSSDAIVSKTLEGIITSWNEAAERMFGYTSDEIIGQSVTKLIPPHLLNEEPLILERLRRGEIVDHFETKRMTKQGKILDISLSISPLKNNSGQIIGASKIARDITAAKQLIAEIQEKEESLRMVVEITRLGTWAYYPLTGEFICSAECRKIYDLPLDREINFDFFLKQVHPDDIEIAEQVIRLTMAPGNDGNYDVQYRILRPTDKETRWIRTQGKVYYNKNQEAERFLGTVLDITEEKQAEQKLKDSVELFTAMADNVPAMIWMSGDDKFCDFFNLTWLEFTGRTLEQESNEGWLGNVHPDDVQLCIDNYNKAFKNQKGVYTEYRLKRYDGLYRWISDNSVPRYNDDGSFAGFISACIDIDDQKRFREKIQESELLLKTISNAAPVGLWMTDKNAQNTFVNDTWMDWTGEPLENQLGIGWLSKVLDEDKKETPTKFREAMEKREKFGTEFRLAGSDGELRWCLTEGSPYYDINGNFAGYAGSVTDITELKKMEQRKDDFIKMASHELKTPITSIKGYVQLLLNIYEEMNEEKLQMSRGTVKSSLLTVSKQVSKLTRLISELLDLSRIESDKLELHRTNFNLSSLVEETVQDIRHTASRHAIIVNNEFEGSLYADKDRIGQVLLNLLTNAIKYSPDADHIELEVTGDQQSAKIKVRDFGIGIDTKDHSKIFERFYRVEGKSEQTFPGFGIGLFIASEIIHRHGGKIDVESKKGKGSSFIVTLPLKGRDK